MPHPFLSEEWLAEVGFVDVQLLDPLPFQQVLLARVPA